MLVLSSAPGCDVSLKAALLLRNATQRNAATHYPLNLSQRWVGMNNVNNRMPKFISIGAQRAGSTWLYANLKAHPGIWLPPMKELHYFDELRVEPFFCKRYKGLLRGRFRANKAAVRAGDWAASDFLWDLKFFGLPRSDRWYASLFSQGKRLVTGEVTPAYSMLSAEAVANIKRINPDLKVIFIMRDPIDRSWSQARKDLPRVFNKTIHEIPKEEVTAWFNKHWCALRSDYLRTLENWFAHFPRHQFFFGFFEEIITTPESLLMRIFDFLEVENSRKYILNTARDAVNAVEASDITPQYEYELARIYEPKVAQLKKMFEPYPETWHRRCVDVLNQPVKGACYNA